jgi:hypothetical protein
MESLLGQMKKILVTTAQLGGLVVSRKTAKFRNQLRLSRSVVQAVISGIPRQV